WDITPQSDWLPIRMLTKGFLTFAAIKKSNLTLQQAASKLGQTQKINPDHAKRLAKFSGRA
ncbi:MAG: hypothetical protein KAG66_06795, partial [Methylococcales bacterium]|nr:hypothetical protein [Methylococcales bacterium]